MGRFKNLPDGSRTIWAAVAEHKGRQRNLVIGAVLAVVLAVGGGYGIFRYLAAEAAVHVVDSWSKLSRCLLGEPLKNNERPSARFRGIQLAALTLGELQRAPGKGDPWPDRCAPLAHVLFAALKDAGRAEEGKQDLAYWTEQLATQLKQEGAYAKDLSEPIDQVWDLATKASLALEPRPDQAAPVAPATPMTIDALAQTKGLTTKPFELKSLRTELNPGPTLRLLVEDKDIPDSPFACTFEAAKAAGRCARLPKALAEASRAGFHLLGTGDEAAPPLVFAGDRGADGVFRGNDGQRLFQANGFAGHASADGFYAVLGWDKPKRGLELVRLSGSDKAKTQAVTPASFQLKTEELGRDAQLLWGQLVLRGKNATNETWLAAAEVQAGATALGATQNIGLLPEDSGAAKAAPGQLSGCRSSEATVLRAVQGNAEFVSFFIGGKWTKPVRVAGIGGTLSCRKSEATITRVVVEDQESPLKTSITAHRCTPASCESESVTLEQMLKGELGLAPTGVVSATAFDGKLLVVWAAGSRGGLRMRLAPPGRMTETQDVILFDDLLKDGAVQKAGSMLDVRLYSFERYAAVVMSTSAGVQALRIEPDGKVAPMAVRWQK
jgi:hypothetical protein